MHWYALYCRSNTEKLVGLKLADAGIDSYYPHIVVPATHARRATERKFFPGYLFARFEMEHHRPVSQIHQVVRIIGYDDRPVAIPDCEVEAVRLMVDAPPKIARTIEPHPYVVGAGDRVTVMRGPLAGLEGYVVYAKGKARVIVSVTMLGRSVSTEVDVHSLKLLAKAAA